MLILASYMWGLLRTKLTIKAKYLKRPNVSEREKQNTKRTCP